MSAEGATKSNILIIVLGVTVLLLLLAVVVLATPLKDRIFATRSAPTIELDIVEGELDEETGLYGYLVEAVVTGRPAPEVFFNRNDGIGEVESNHTLILLAEGESFVLQATATNALGSASASLELTGGMESTNGTEATHGTIEGHIVYPSAGVPPDLQIVAENITTGQEYFASGVITDSKYTTGFGFIIQVPPGDYHLYASNPGDDYRAYYDEYVQNNFTGDSHAKIVVTITAGMHVDDAIVGNWWIVPEDTSNRPPVITGISFSSDTLETGRTYTVTVAASDPDGDPMSHIWRVSAGSVGNFVANTMSWTTPSTAGNYQVTVTVRDGRGGEDVYSRTVAVNPRSPDVSEYVVGPVVSETGHIVKELSTHPGAFVFVGDDRDNNMYRGLISFDIGPLAGASIQEVELRLKDPTEMGNPSALYGSGTPGLIVWVIHWGTGPFELRHYGSSGLITRYYTDYDITYRSIPGEGPPGEWLATKLQQAINEGKNRFQIRLQFGSQVSNNDNTIDAVMYLQGDIKLSVLYER